MKRSIILSILVGVLFAGCENAEYRASGNSIYLVDANGSAKSSTIVFEGTMDIPVNVRLAQKSDYDVTVMIGFNPENIARYNELNGTEYVPLPEDMLPSDASVTIPAGEISGSYSLHLEDFDTKGITYAIPVQLGDVVTGNVSASNGQGQFVYVLSKPLVVSVPVMKSTGSERSNCVHTTWAEPVVSDALTIEAWIKMSGYSVNNQAIFDSNQLNGEQSGGNIYIRFGDANRPYSYMQANIHNGTVESAKDLKADTWYHWAFVYDGTTTYIYQDGVQIGMADTQKDGPVTIERFLMISSGSRYFRDECCLSQVRVWSKIRTAQEIQANMFNEVNPNNPDLIAYWPMDEGEGNSFADITGNGHDATVDSGVLLRWEHGVRFDELK